MESCSYKNSSVLIIVVITTNTTIVPRVTTITVLMSTITVTIIIIIVTTIRHHLFPIPSICPTLCTLPTWTITLAFTSHREWLRNSETTQETESVPLPGYATSTLPGH